MTQSIGLGGGCHWCSEAIFEHLKGVLKVEQGWIKPKEIDSFSEAVIVTFDTDHISLDTLIEIHLYTHSSTSNHQFRKKYRSAIYTFDKTQFEVAKEILQTKQKLFDKRLITQVYCFLEFRSNEEQYLHYYQKNSSKQFCQVHIEPKLQLLLKKYSQHYKKDNNANTKTL